MSKSSARKRIAVITGSRAEYGLLQPVIQRLHDDIAIELQLFVTGMHLSNEYGNTFTLIEKDGFSITEKITTLVSGETAISTCKSTALGLMAFAEQFSRYNPEIIILLGDRYECFAAAQAALFLQIPMAHIHGGELTEGSFDDAIRHSISKMSHLHFPATKEYRKRLIQLGEAPNHVVDVGSLGVEIIKNTKLLDKQKLANDLNIESNQAIFLITFHPVTLDEGQTQLGLDAIFEALKLFPDTTLIFTYANADTKGSYINSRIDRFVSVNKQRARVFKSLGQQRYLSLLSHANVIIGNSSSGIIEAPALKTPTVNIGTRQHGRLKAKSIIDCDAYKATVVIAIQKALHQSFIDEVNQQECPYGEGNSSETIVETIKSTDLRLIKHKAFFDVPFDIN